MREQASVTSAGKCTSRGTATWTPQAELSVAYLDIESENECMTAEVFRPYKAGNSKFRNKL